MNYLDLQINGYAGVDFNQEDLDAESFGRACRAIADDGVTGFLLTICTEKLDVMCRLLQKLVKLREQDPLVREIVVGFHLEGPFINEADGYRGAHPADAIHPANVDEMKRLLDAAGGLTRLVTLAPERDKNLAVTKMLASQGIAVAGGHCDPTLDELTAAIDAGLSMFTHLGNGCPMYVHRHDNITQRVLSLTDKLWITFIADGAHVPMYALGNYLKTAGIDRCIIVSDAVAPAGLGPGKYTVGRWEVLIGEDMVARSPDGSHLIGSALTMQQAERNLREQLGLGDEQIQQLMVDNPHRAIKRLKKF